MIAQFSIQSIGNDVAGDDLVRLAGVLARSGLHYHLGPTSTVVEGTWDEVLTVIQQCHAHAAHRSNRVVTSIVLDDRKAGPNELRELLSSVEKAHARASHGSDPEVEC